MPIEQGSHFIDWPHVETDMKAWREWAGMSDEEKIDTGFDAVLAGDIYEPPEPTATVTQIADATKALVQLPHITAVEMAKLAREIAMDIKETHVILREFNLTQTQYDYLSEHNSFFRNALEAAAVEWHSPLSTKERVAVAAAAILEDSLPTLGARMQNRGEGLPGVTEAAKLFAKLAGIGEREHGGPPVGERFVINIDLGGSQKVTLEAGDAPQAHREPTVSSQITHAAFPEGERISLRSQPEGAGTLSSSAGKTEDT